MSSTIGKVSAVFTSNTGGLRRGVSEAVSSFARMERSLASLKSGMGFLSTVAGAQLFGSIASGVSNAVRSVTGWVQTSADAIDKTSKFAQRAGLLYSEMATLELAAGLAGVGVDQLMSAMDKGNKVFIAATQGNKQANAAFEKLGLSVADLAGLSDMERFERITQAIGGLATPAERSAAAMAIFGKSGGALVPLFNGGADAISQARDDVNAFGLALTSAQGQNVEAMNDSFTRVGAAVKGIVDQVTAFLAPAVTNVANIFTNFIADVGGVNLGQAIGEGILEGALTLAKIADQFIAGLGSVWEFGRSLVASWSAAFDFAGRIFSFFSGIVNGFQAGLGAIILAFGKIGEFFVAAASRISEALGFGSFDSTLAGIQGFNQQVFDDMVSNANAAASDFASTFGDASQRAADALPGPFEAAVVDGIAAAREAAAQIEEAVPRQIDVAPVVVKNEAPQPVKAIDSRSAEGVKEMLRLMSGGGDGNVQEQQLGVLEAIRDGIEDIVDADPDFAIADF